MRRVAVIVLLGAVLAACGGEETISAGPETVAGTTPQTETQQETQTETGAGEGGTAAEGDPAAGEALYEANGCGSCHTFGPAGSTATAGPNLDELPQLAQNADRGSVEEFTRESIEDPNAYVEEGFPAIMPAYDQLDDQQLTDLVAFLTQS